MKFVLKSSDLLKCLLAVGRVINSKNTLPILDNFLFDINENKLTITASDLETTLVTSLPLNNSNGVGRVAIQAKLLTDTVKEFPEQPLTFEINEDNLLVTIFSDKGEFSIPGHSGDDYPTLPNKDNENICKMMIAPVALLTGISKTLFATADDELRPMMNGIYIELSTENITFVSSDAHKLVRYRRFDAHSEAQASFILHKKPAALLKNILNKQEDDVIVEFDSKNAFVSFGNYKLVCTLPDGKYPRYESVIPQNNPNKMTVNRAELHNILRRVGGFSNPATNLVRMCIEQGKMNISAQDLDFSINAHEEIKCEYNGPNMEIGFKSIFLLDILSNMESNEVNIELSDSARAGLFLPTEESSDNEETLMLLMPMMLNA